MMLAVFVLEPLRYVVVNQENLVWVLMSDDHIILLDIVVNVVVLVHYSEAFDELYAYFVTCWFAEIPFWNLLA